MTENDQENELKRLSDMLADLCAALSQILQVRYPDMAADIRFNRAYCIAIKLVNNHIQTECAAKPHPQHRLN